MMQTTEALARALFIIVAFVLAGLAHSAWLGSRWSRHLLIPLDAGLRLRGRRVIGDNKTVRGFVVGDPEDPATYISGRHKPGYMMQGLDQSFDAHLPPEPIPVEDERAFWCDRDLPALALEPADQMKELNGRAAPSRFMSEKQNAGRKSGIHAVELAESKRLKASRGGLRNRPRDRAAHTAIKPRTRPRCKGCYQRHDRPSDFDHRDGSVGNG
jgi:hypothetical protein